MPISIPDDRAVSGVGLKPTLEFGLLRSEVLTARGYPEVDGDMARRFTRPLCTISSVDQIGHSGAHRNPKESGHSPIISTNPSSRTLPDRFRSS